MSGTLLLTLILVAVFAVGLATGMAWQAWGIFCDKWYERKLRDSEPSERPS